MQGMDNENMKCFLVTILPQKHPMQPCFLRPRVIDMQVAHQPLSHHPHPSIQRWVMNPIMLQRGIHPMENTILPNMMNIFSLHDMLKCNLMEISI